MPDLQMKILIDKMIHQTLSKHFFLHFTVEKEVITNIRRFEMRDWLKHLMNSLENQLIISLIFIQRKVDALLPVLFDEVC